MLIIPGSLTEMFEMEMWLKIDVTAKVNGKILQEEFKIKVLAQPRTQIFSTATELYVTAGEVFKLNTMFYYPQCTNSDKQFEPVTDDSVVSCSLFDH